VADEDDVEVEVEDVLDPLFAFCFCAEDALLLAGLRGRVPVWPDDEALDELEEEVLDADAAALRLRWAAVAPELPEPLPPPPTLPAPRMTCSPLPGPA
jgi:hypothetical protein